MAYGDERQVSGFPLCASLRRPARTLCVSVGFSSSLIPDDWRLVYSLNPMVGVIDGFRWGRFGRPGPHLPSRFRGELLRDRDLLFLGLRKFRAMERAFADLI
jgi:lipopolysaccharide transport system permease protein